jgi:hypothetical protein
LAAPLAQQKQQKKTQEQCTLAITPSADNEMPGMNSVEAVPQTQQGIGPYMDDAGRVPLRLEPRTTPHEDESKEVLLEEHLVKSIASIPHLLKMILLINDDQHRKYVLSCSIVQRVLASKYSIGDWLVGMLQSDDIYVVNRVITYLKLASEVSLKEEKNMPAPVSSRRESIWDFSTRDDPNSCSHQSTRVQLYSEVSHLQGFVPSLLSLSNHQVEEVSTTTLVKGVLDRIVAKGVIIVLFDGIFLILLIVGFRTAINCGTSIWPTPVYFISSFGNSARRLDFL